MKKDNLFIFVVLSNLLYFIIESTFAMYILYAVISFVQYQYINMNLIKNKLKQTIYFAVFGVVESIGIFVVMFNYGDRTMFMTVFSSICLSLFVWAIIYIKKSRGKISKLNTNIKVNNENVLVFLILTNFLYFVFPYYILLILVYIINTTLLLMFWNSSGMQNNSNKKILYVIIYAVTEFVGIYYAIRMFTDISWGILATVIFVLIPWINIVFIDLRMKNKRNKLP